MDRTLILGVPLKRRAATPGRTEGAWFPVLQRSTRISAEAWVQFVAVSGLEQVAPNLFRKDDTEYMFERRSDDRA
jgi:hypothetical protein